jgi:tRNA pseudouridine55 synthase
MEGLLLIRKPAGVTSFGALSPVKRMLGTGKVGHTGTLDRFAEGLLAVLVGPMTRFVPYLTELDKEYEAVFEFGAETDTLDPEGEVIATAELPAEAHILRRVSEFTGTILQAPPVYSAVHSGGERAHRIARSGRQVTLPARPVTVHRFDVLSWEPPFLRVRVACSKGTYIRSLARDLALACGSRGYVKELVRTRIGAFTLEEAVRPEEISRERLIGPREFIGRIGGIGVVHADRRTEAEISYGRPLPDAAFAVPQDGLYAVFSAESGSFLCLVERTHGRYGYRFVGTSGLKRTPSG